METVVIVDLIVGIILALWGAWAFGSYRYEMLKYYEELRNGRNGKN